MSSRPWHPLVFIILLTAGLTHCTPSTSTDGLQEKCGDGLDNDRNGATDCEDTACAAFPTCNGGEHCYNGADDDGDGQIDCDDSACSGSFICLEDIEDCANGRDDDGDGRIDCDDSACQRTSVCTPGAEACSGGLDEDGDGRSDCEDDDCKSVFACVATFEEPGNQRDDDDDDLVDCEDPDIARTSDCIAGGERCDDGSDNDGDGAVDCADVDCAQTKTCLLGVEVCNNGIDDNGDGAVDCADARCAFTGFCGEEICIPGTGDEDGNGLADCDDPVCDYATTCLEEFIPPMICPRDTFGEPDCADVACQLEPECQPEGPEICGDGFDNDRDGLTDCEDVTDCVDPAIRDEDYQATCIVELCGDENGQVIVHDSMIPLPIANDADMQANFPAQGGPTVFRGTLSFVNEESPPTTRYDISPAHSLRCVLPDSEGLGRLEVTNVSLSSFAGLSGLRVVQDIRIELWQEFPGFAGLSELMHVIDTIEIDAARDPVLQKPRTPFSFQGLDALKTFGEFVYLKKTAFDSVSGDEVATRIFDFDGLGELVEVRGNLITLQDSADQVDSCAITPGQDPLRGMRDWEIQGNFFQVDSFAGLESLRRIGGDLCAAPTMAFQDFDGLNALERVGGDLMIGLADGPFGASTASMISLEGLQALREIQGSLAVKRDRFMTDSVTCIFDIQSLTGLQGLQQIGGDLSLCMSPGFDGFDALSNLQSIEGDVYLTATPGDPSSSPITPFTAFSMLTTIGGTLLLENTAIDTLQGLEGLTELGGLELHGNTQLTSIAALQGITTFGSGSLWLDDSNTQLMSATGLEALTTIEGDMILIGRREFLDAMQAIERVEGKLYLSRLFNVTDLTALDTLTYIGGLGLDQLPDLSSLDGLPMQLEYNESVLIARLSEDPPTELGVLSNVVRIGGDLTVEEIDIVLPFVQLEVVEGNMAIRAMPSLPDLSVLGRLDTVGGTITLDNNPLMTSITGLEGLAQITNIVIRDNEVLDDLNGLSNVNTIGELSVINNVTLTDFNFNSLATVNGNLVIRGNEQLTNISSLYIDVMSFAGERITIENNASLDCAPIIDLINTYELRRADMSTMITLTVNNNLSPTCP